MKANKLFQKAQELSKDLTLAEDFKKRQIRWYAVLIVSVLLYSSTFKGGISSISILGVSIVIVFRSCLPSHNTDVTDTLTLRDDTTNVKKQNKDNYYSNVTISDSNSRKAIYEAKDYASVAQILFEPDNKCILLSALGTAQRQFINHIDSVDHMLEPYFINSNDQFYYIHVVAYFDIKEAAFQMHHINLKTGFKAEILEIINDRGDLLYAVVIGKFRGDEAIRMAELIEKWKSKCFSSEVEIGCYYNG